MKLRNSFVMPMKTFNQLEFYWTMAFKTLACKMRNRR